MLLLILYFLIWLIDMVILNGDILDYKKVNIYHILVEEEKMVKLKILILQKKEKLVVMQLHIE